jgi:hypothetical protein
LSSTRSREADQLSKASCTALAVRMSSSFTSARLPARTASCEPPDSTSATPANTLIALVSRTRSVSMRTRPGSCKCTRACGVSSSKPRNTSGFSTRTLALP